MSAPAFIFLSKSIYIFIHALFNIWQIGRALIKLRKIHIILCYYFCIFVKSSTIPAQRNSQYLIWKIRFISESFGCKQSLYCAVKAECSLENLRFYGVQFQHKLFERLSMALRHILWNRPFSSLLAVPCALSIWIFLPFCVYKEGRSQLLNIGQGTRPARTHFIGLSVLERGKMTQDKIEDC